MAAAVPMNDPLAAARLFACAFLLGCLLGLLHGFLRPLREKLPNISDAIFAVVLFYVWLYLSFALCRGDIRMGYTAGLFLQKKCANLNCQFIVINRQREL